MKYTDVEYMDEDGYPQLVFTAYPDASDDEDEMPVSWMVPLEAIGNRAELYGLESLEHVLEYLGRETTYDRPTAEVTTDVIAAYNSVVNSEFAQTLMPEPAVEDAANQTALTRMQISSTQREDLEAKRREALDKLGVHQPSVDSPQLMAMSTISAKRQCAQAMEAEEAVVDRTLQILEEHREELEAWRMETPFNACPQLRESMEAEAQRIREAGRQAAMKGARSDVQ